MNEWKTLTVKVQAYGFRLKNELEKLCKEDKGLDVIITVVLLAIGLIVAGVLARYATQIIGVAGKQVNQITNGSGGGGTFGGGGGTFGGGGGGGSW